MNTKSQINVRLNPNQTRLLLHLLEFEKKIINTTYNEIARALVITKKAARERIEVLEREHLILKSVTYLGQSDKPTGIKIRLLGLATRFIKTDRLEKEINESLKNYVLSVENFSIKDWIEIRLRTMHKSATLVKKKINSSCYIEESLTVRELNKIQHNIEIYISEQKTRNHFRENFNIDSSYHNLQIRHAMIAGLYGKNNKIAKNERDLNRELSKKLTDSLYLLMDEPNDKKSWIGLAAIFEEMSMDHLVVHVFKMLNSLGNNYLRSEFHDRFESIVGGMPELSIHYSGL